MLRVKRKKEGRRPKDKEYTADDLEKAVAAYKEGTSLREAEKKYGVPRSTISDKALKKTAMGRKSGPLTTLTTAEEQRLPLSKWINRLKKKSAFPLKSTTSDDELQKNSNHQRVCRARTSLIGLDIGCQSPSACEVKASTVSIISPSEEDLLELLHDRIYHRKSREDAIGLINLPDEILLRIISLINPLSETFVNLKYTCRRLRAITQDISLYPHKDLRIPPLAMFSFSTLQMILDFSKNTLTSLDISECDDINDYTLFRLVSNVKRLEKLNLRGCRQLTNAALRVIGNHTDCLTWIDFSRCPLITCTGILHLFMNLGRTLEHVNMSNCIGIRNDPHKLTPISRYFFALKHLSVGWYRELVKINPILDMDLDRLTKGCTQLTYLDISYSHSTNTSMNTIATNCPNLETLLAKQCCVQDVGLQSIGQGLPLDLTDCWYITDRGIERLAFGCKHLESINLTRCYEIHGNGIVVLACHCKKLTRVILRQCLKIDDKAVQYVALSNTEMRLIDVSFNVHLKLETVQMIRRRRPQLRLLTESCPCVSLYGTKSRFQFLQVDMYKKMQTPEVRKKFKFEYRETAV